MTIDLEKMLFEYMDQIKFLITPEIWGNAILNCSKNEIFILMYLYRQTEANMTQIAEYIDVPLNTATGIITRMEKKYMVTRSRSETDKRIVTIMLTENGKVQMQDILKEFYYYGEKIMKVLGPAELELIGKILERVTKVLKDENIKTQNAAEGHRVRKIEIE